MFEALSGLQGALSMGSALWIAVAALITLFIVTMLLAVSVVAHHMVSDRNRRLNRKRYEAAAELLAPALVSSTGDLLDAVRECMGLYGRRATGLVLRQARRDLRGQSGDRVSMVLAATGVIDELLRDLRSQREWKREHAARGLGECGGPRALTALISIADDEAPGVRRAARESLLVLGDADGIRVAISSFLTDLPRRAGWRRSFYSRLSAVEPLSLLRLIRSGRLDASEIKLALEALGDAESQAAMPIAAELLASAAPELRATAARVIGKLDRVELMPRLTDQLSDSEWYVRAAAARSLEWMLAGAAVSRMDAAVRTAAIQGLTRCLSDRSWWVRANASRALAREGTAGRRQLFGVATREDRYAGDAAVAALSLVDLEPDEQRSFAMLIDWRRAQAAGVQVATVTGSAS